MNLLTFRRTLDWLSNLITGDEKWVLYVNHTRKKQWLGSGQIGVPTPKPESHPKKVLLSVWWGIKGVIHWELMPSGTTVTAEVYCRQLETLAEKLHGTQDRIYFLHDNARPHIAKKTQEKILNLGWTVIPHPPYSPDLAPTDYHLFRSLANHLSGKKFDKEDKLREEIETFFISKSQDFYKRGIENLPSRWRQVVTSNGAYIIDK
jgi:histone-lysine N-methyltransferase SETMAR